MRIFLRDPSGDAEFELLPIRGTDRIRIGETELLIYYGEPSPFNAAQEIYIEFVPEQAYVESGIWIFRFLGKGREDTYVDLWLPSSAALGRIRLFSNRRRRRRSRSRPRRSVRSLSAPTTAGPGSMPRFPAAGTPESTMPRSRISQRRASGSWLRRAEADMRRSQERPLRRPSSPEPRRFSWSGGS